MLLFLRKWSVVLLPIGIVLLFSVVCMFAPTTSFDPDNDTKGIIVSSRPVAALVGAMLPEDYKIIIPHGGLGCCGLDIKDIASSLRNASFVIDTTSHQSERLLSYVKKRGIGYVNLMEDERIQEAVFNLFSSVCDKDPNDCVFRDIVPLLGNIDVHFLSSPKAAIVFVTVIKDYLIDLLPEKQFIESKFKILIGRLNALDKTIHTKLLNCNTPIFGFHSGLEYFAIGYNLKYVGSIFNASMGDIHSSVFNIFRRYVKRGDKVCVVADSSHYKNVNSGLLRDMKNLDGDLSLSLIDIDGLGIGLESLENGFDEYLVFVEKIADVIYDCACN